MRPSGTNPMPAIATFLGALVSAALTHKPSRPEFKFAPDSALEGSGFEPSVPPRETTLFETAP
jgi:hypothetical protein